MIRKLLVLATAVALSASVYARETISIVFPYTPTHGTTPVFYPLIEEANKLQDKYNFVFETKPGGDGILALNYMNQSPANRVSIIAPGFVENADTGKVNESDYVHVAGLGDMCMGVFSKYGDEKIGFASYKKGDEITIGGVGWGNGSHLIGLSVGEKYNIPVRNIVFKSNREGLINLAQDGGVTFVLDRVDAFNDIRGQAKIQAKIIATTCAKRIKSIPHVKTLEEQGIYAPTPWLIITSNKAMSAETRNEIARIVNQAVMAIGEDRVWELSSLQPLAFSRRDVNEYYNQKSTQQRRLLKKFQPAIDSDRGTTK